MRKLWKELGAYDALVEYNECAIRQFVRKWEEVKKTGKTYSKFLKEESADVKMYLGYIKETQVLQDIYRWYMIQPYGCIENFIKSFKEDLKPFGFDLNLDYSGKRPLERLILGLKDAGISISIDSYKQALDNYYYLFRNQIAHKLEGTEDKIKQNFDKIDKIEVLELYPTLFGALSAPGVLTFDDYTLCTANLKNITDTLTTDVYLKIDWHNYDISLLKARLKTKSFLQDQQRLSGYIRQYLSTEYGIEIDDDTVSIIKTKL